MYRKIKEQKRQMKGRKGGKKEERKGKFGKEAASQSLCVVVAVEFRARPGNQTQHMDFELLFHHY